MILVTGGTGLVGSHLLFELINSGEKVRAIFRSEESLLKVKEVFSYYTSKEKAKEFFNHIDWIEADITDVPTLENAFFNITKVYHCAAIISFDPSKDDVLRKVNIEGTANVVNFSIKNKIEKICFVSSIATLDQKPGEKVVTEESHWNKELNHDMYAITKYGAEMEVWRASQEGVKVIIVNPGIIIGPGFWESGSGKIFKQVNDGLNYYLEKVTGFVGVFDVVKPMQELMNSSISNEQYILVANNLSFQLVLNQVAEALNKNPPQKKLKPWMVQIGWLTEVAFGWMSKRERRLGIQSSKSLFRDHYYFSDKIKLELNYEFGSVASAIKDTAKAFLRNPN